MDTEILAKILEMVSQAGEGAYSLAVLFLLVPYFKMITVLGVFFLVLKTVLRLINSFTFIERVKEIMDYEQYGEWTRRERVELLQMVAKARDKSEPREED